MSKEKIKIMTISDHPLSPSGVGIQTKNMIEAMLKTGKYTFVSLGGAVNHPNYKPMKTEEYGDDWVIYPVDGYGNQETIRSLLRSERPDVLWYMTDPRFYVWLWQMAQEIRAYVPMVYYHVWDNYPYPSFNRAYYESNDFIATISKVTDDIVANVAPTVDRRYVPHAIDTSIFTKLPEDLVSDFRTNSFPNEKNKDRVVFFWNNRNARRKMTGSIMWWFKEFLDEIGHDKACLILHTDPKDKHGQDCDAIISELDCTDGQILISKDKVSPQGLSLMYNLADCTINISDAEGFGLATLESLACETPILVNMTGGLQEQVTNGKDWFGVGLQPASQTVVGSQDVPYIYEDRVNREDFMDALRQIYNKTKKERAKMGKAGREHVLANYGMDKFVNNWKEVLEHVCEKYGSWQNRKHYNPLILKEVV